MFFISCFIRENTSKLRKVRQCSKVTCIPSLLTTNNDALAGYFFSYVYGHKRGRSLLTVLQFVEALNFCFKKQIRSFYYFSLVAVSKGLLHCEKV